MSTATVPNLPASKPRDVQLTEIRQRVQDVRETFGERIDKGENARFTLLVFKEMEFLLSEIDRLNKRGG